MAEASLVVLWFYGALMRLRPPPAMLQLKKGSHCHRSSLHCGKFFVLDQLRLISCNGNSSSSSSVFTRSSQIHFHSLKKRTSSGGRKGYRKGRGKVNEGHLFIFHLVYLRTYLVLHKTMNV